MKNTLETRLGIFFAVALVAGAIILEMVGGLDFLRGGLRLNARFKNIQELKKGDPVKLAGKPVGRVEAIEFADAKVLVRMKILEAKAVVRTDTRAAIKFSGLMGQNYVALDFGTDKGEIITLPDQEIATDEPADIGALLSKLDGVAGDMKKITANFTDFKLDEIVMPFSDFLKESRPRITGILTNVQAVTEQINSGKGTVGRLVYDETLYSTALSTVTNLNSTSDDARELVAQGKTVVADVRAGKGTVGRLLTDDQLYREITEAATNLKEILQKVNRGQGSVGKLVNDDALINNAKLTLQKLDKATESLEDQGPLSVIGILVNPLF
jgi:phospholipid/cholesterol/gamma-HCH transport system substrate-binding protein